MQNKEKCLHATPLSETVLIPTIQIREGRKSKEKKKKKGMKEGRKQRGERAGWKGRERVGGRLGEGEEEEEEEQEGRDSTLKCFVLDL